MSDTEIHETARQRREREAAERAAAEQDGQQGNGEQGDGEQVTPEPTAEQIAEAAELAKIKGFTATEAGEFRAATTPVRNRKAVQLAMDAVAEQAYSDWADADRPSTWARMPVITYFLDPADVAEYRKLIRRACDIVTPQPYEKDGTTVEPSGVRVRFGKEFVLTEKMAAKIGKPDEAGKTVLAWAAIDKRHVADRNGGS